MEAQLSAVTTTSSEARPLPDGGGVSARVGELYQAHGRMVVRLCRLLLRDTVEAQDAAQQTFLSAQRSLLGGSAPREPAAWLATIARNECLARIRARMREPLSADEPVSELPDPFQAVVRRADVRALRDGLAELAPAQRDAFLLREFAGLSYDELARLLGVSEPAVESLLVRARRRLRRALATANAVAVPVGVRGLVVRPTSNGLDDGSVVAVAMCASLPVAKVVAVGAGGALVAGSGSVAQRTPPPDASAAAAAAGLRDEPALRRVRLAGFSGGASRSTWHRSAGHGAARAAPGLPSLPSRGLRGGGVARDDEGETERRRAEDRGDGETVALAGTVPGADAEHDDDSAVPVADDRSLQSEPPSSGPGPDGGAASGEGHDGPTEPGKLLGGDGSSSSSNPGGGEAGVESGGSGSSGTAGESGSGGSGGGRSGPDTDS